MLFFIPKLLAASICPLSTASIPALTISDTYAAEFKAIAIIADVNGLKSIPKNILEPAYL